VKTCPHCGGQLRPSVIKCVHCGSRLDEQPTGQPTGTPLGVPAGVPAGSPSGAGAAGAPAAGGSSASGAPAPSAAAAGAPARPGSDRTPAPPPSVFDPPKPPSPDPWVTPSERLERPVQPPLAPVVVAAGTAPAAAAPRARTARRVDLGLLAAGALALASAAVALTSLSLPWVTGTLAAKGPRDKIRQVAELPFFADDAIVRNVVLGLAVAAAVLGLLWFWYGLDRGVQLPLLAHPGVALLAGICGWALVGVTRLGAVVWETGFLAHAREAGLTKAAMQTLLDDRNRRVLTFATEAGTTRFAIAASLALLAGLLAWWSQRERPY